MSATALRWLATNTKPFFSSTKVVDLGCVPVSISQIFCFRLLLAEKAGKLCRDDSVEGLRFYPNRFVTVS